MNNTKTDIATARPWRVHTSGVGDLIIEQVTGQMHPPLIATMSRWDGLRHEVEANAKLLVQAVNEHVALCRVADAAARVEAHSGIFPDGYLSAMAGLEVELQALHALRTSTVKGSL